MSEDQNKTEKPTPFKLREAQKKGQVSKSLELNALITSICFVALAAMFFAQISSVLANDSIRVLVLSADFLWSINNLITLFSELTSKVMVIFAPVILMFVVAAIAVTISQTGFVFTTHLLKPDFSKLNPATGIKRLFTKKVLFDLAKNVLKICFFFLVIWFSYPGFIVEMSFVMQGQPAQIADVWLALFIKVSLIAAALSLPFMLTDFLFTKWDFMQKMRMSAKEVKDEHKKREGDPQVKSKQKQLQRELLKKTAALQSVKQADVIIVNPTHIALALEYNKDKMPAPKVVALGKGELAGKIREQGRRFGIPIIQNKALARRLYKSVQLGGFVPVDSFSDLAPIFRWLLGMDARSTN
ncbi:flagellar biosynthesis protein FlhB [Rheinheimera aquimaris]|jgi:flagellar biosynthesis protein FlhB|uniref:EscU/YscU/HrcU family type III secretion system export apparatus switch protein n=2 Tax=Rheinheimera aquimaris TaxID=412437 RepID=UPI001065942F|nr:EscU/YscU/HrcU family type III secretion system export apparatus switch protein [Rheinheimera aquimaris]MCD1600367.1 EscU/YscU/HrcU family type III secretion system export apparatus switch protein [Rheinheimera aquimaris]|tara:strand:+ start:2915 stop:3982 length:1068 start_codon:yes stop_codon:yes gene_type:complete